MRRLYKVLHEDNDNVEPNAYGEILISSPLTIKQNLDTELYEWQIENYESKAKECWTIQAIPTSRNQSCYSIKAIPIVREKNYKETPSLLPTDLTSNSRNKI